jgi:hypothetical protein
MVRSIQSEPGYKISVADPDHLDADTDPTSEKTVCGSGSDHAPNKIL